MQNNMALKHLYSTLSNIAGFAGMRNNMVLKHNCKENAEKSVLQVCKIDIFHTVGGMITVC